MCELHVEWVVRLPMAVGGMLSSVETVNEMFAVDTELSCRQMDHSLALCRS